MSLDRSRVYLHLPVNYSLEPLIRMIRTTEPSRELITITSDMDSAHISTKTSFQIFQISQPLLDALMKSDPILLIEASSSLGQFTIPRETGRIIVFGNDLSTLKALTESVRFMSGPDALNLIISPFDLAIFLNQIGLLVPNGPGMDFTYRGIPVAIRMSNPQYKEYLARLNAERYSALQVTNFLYPKSLQDLHNLERNQRPKITPDLSTSEGGWITPEITLQLAINSPKLLWSSSYIRENPGKHVIYTSFNDSNGAKVISTILTLLGHRVIRITGNDRQKDRLHKLRFFEEVLVTDLHPFADLPGVSSLIIFEQTGRDSLFSAYLKRLPVGIPVLLLVSFGPEDQPTIETTNYLELAQNLSSRDTVIRLLKTGTTDPADLKIPGLTPQELRRRIPGPLSLLPTS